MTLKVVKDWFDEDALCQRRSSRSVNLISQVFKLGLCGTGGLGLVFLGVLLRLPAQRVFSLQLRKLFHYYCSDSTHQRELLQIYLSFEKEGLNTQISILKLGQFYLIFACSSPIFISLFLQLLAAVLHFQHFASSLLVFSYKSNIWNHFRQKSPTFWTTFSISTWYLFSLFLNCFSAFCRWELFLAFIKAPVIFCKLVCKGVKT